MNYDTSISTKEWARQLLPTKDQLLTIRGFGMSDPENKLYMKAFFLPNGNPISWESVKTL